VFIDGLIRLLKSDASLGVRIAGEQLVGLLYADDIVLLASDPLILQRMLDVISRYAQQWRFHFNGRKSEVVVQGTKTEVSEAQAHAWKLDGPQLSVVTEYMYLGMECGLPPLWPGQVILRTSSTFSHPTRTRHSPRWMRDE
jgi:hypothetical protein